ncbi:MAG: peptidase and chymotrypsin/Hap [Solirubrobacterales bacterium]|nr:peptidase and chymotrypsin/Hap [Solirubrobacterales bacterium]
MRRAAAVSIAAVALAGCGGGANSLSGGGGGTTATAAGGGTRTVIERVQVIKPVTVPGAKGFDPAVVYQRAAPGVVTVISVFPGSSLTQLLGGGGSGQEGLGSGFVIDTKGDIATNAHVVTTGTGAGLKRATSVFVQFEDGNQVPARIVGADPNADVALIHVDAGGLTLRPLVLGDSRQVVVGQPVAAIGSPFGEPQSLSVGVISGLNRSIDSLNKFSISNAIQTDAAINHGNSGGPLVDAQGRVLGINSQIQSTGGGGEGVGFAVPVASVQASIAQLMSKGRVDYAYVGVSSVPLFPQLAQHLGLPVDHGALIQTVTPGGPGERAGLKAGTKSQTFQVSTYQVGGDVITAVDGRPLNRQSDLSDAIAGRQPGERVTLEVYRGGKKLSVKVTLGARPNSSGGGK